MTALSVAATTSAVCSCSLKSGARCRLLAWNRMPSENMSRFNNLASGISIGRRTMTDDQDVYEITRAFTIRSVPSGFASWLNPRAVAFGTSAA
jgi:hypothetical protein